MAPELRIGRTWIAKAALQGAFSALPGGQRLNLLFQRHVTKSLPQSAAEFSLHVVEAARHVRLYERHVERVAAARFYEFGAGWDLIGPLTLASAGVPRQRLVDVRRNVRLDLVNHSKARINRHLEVLQREAGVELHLLDPSPCTSLEELRRTFGIAYHAPRDARDTGFSAESVDCMTSTFTLEHIPARDIVAILVEGHRLLRPGGLLSCSIDMKDHYSYFDGSIGPHNFLRFSDDAWRLANPSLHYQNRLRRSDYLRLFEEAGFAPQVVHEVTPTESELERLRGLPLAPRYAGMDEEDLGCMAMHVIAVKSGSSPVIRSGRPG
jgi:Methyltransferase domain